MGRKNHRRIVGNLVELLDEHRAAQLELFDHVAIMDNFVTHIDRRAIARQRLLDDLNRAIDPRAESAWSSEQDAKRRQRRCHERALCGDRAFTTVRPTAVKTERTIPKRC